ncbi:MAG: COG1361 S-layer family protein, partial [Nitrososphaera sp.]
IGQNTFELGSIPANTTAEIRPTIYPSDAAGQEPQAINVQISFGNSYGVRQTITIPVGLVVLPRALDSDISVSLGQSASTIITAGKLHDYRFVISNTAAAPLSDVLITLSSQSESIKILGESEWTVKQMDAGYTQEFATQVFAPTSLIGDSTNFDLSVRYLSDGQTETDSVDLGAYIDGEISIRAYELEVNYIGGTPNIVGNLLNEGNTVALFTTIEVVETGGLVIDQPPQQYLGDLDENSPLPFSIPVDVGTANAGTYPVAIKVTYKDNLRQLHTLDFSSDVQFVPEVAADESASGQGMDMAIPIVIGIVAAAAIVAIILVRRRRKRALRHAISARKQDDFESLLDSQRQEKKG